MNEKLKPCPFCGGQPKIYDIVRRYVDDEPGVPPRKRWKVMCGARVDCCAILNDYASPQEAAQAWNRRFTS